MKFRNGTLDHFSDGEIGDFRHTCVFGTNIDFDCDWWSEFIGLAPDQKAYYEFECYRPVEKTGSDTDTVWAKALVSRRRSDNLCHIEWRVKVP